MLKTLSLRDYVIVDRLDVEWSGGFTVLTGETGAGKSILIDALQLVLGERADAAVVREGSTRADVSAEFEQPASLAGWLAEHGFEAETETEAEAAAEPSLLLRRTVDKGGKSRAWINGSSATVAQLRELAEHLVDIHGQHAWQGLTRPAAVRELVDTLAGSDTASLHTAWDAWRDAQAALDRAQEQRAELDQQREQLLWELQALDRLDPAPGEWDDLNAQQQRLAHAQALIAASQSALACIDDEGAADTLTRRAVSALESVVAHDAQLAEVLEELRSAQVQLHDAARSLGAYLERTDTDPRRLAELDTRLSDWLSASRRHRCAPADLPAWRESARVRLASLQAAIDTEALQAQVARSRKAWQAAAQQVSATRRRLAPELGQAVSDALQTLGMPGAAFEVALAVNAEPQRHGAENVEFLVAGHAGVAPRPLAKVASGGELSRIALAIAVSTRSGLFDTLQKTGAATLIAPRTVVFDEVDSGIGGSVGDTVGRLLKRLGQSRQTLAVTHLAQVAACADHHHVVSKATEDGRTLSRWQTVVGEDRVREVARMLGGEHLSGTGRAHAADMLAAANQPPDARPASARRVAGTTVAKAVAKAATKKSRA
jgi:DNA repair protein RecN (Recombination protein N)